MTTGRVGASEAPLHIRLRKGEFLAVAEGYGLYVRCISGTVWATQPGDDRDHVCNAGGATLFTLRSPVLVRSLPPLSELQLSRARAGQWQIRIHAGGREVLWTPDQTPQ